VLKNRHNNCSKQNTGAQPAPQGLFRGIQAHAQRNRKEREERESDGRKRGGSRRR